MKKLLFILIVCSTVFTLYGQKDDEIVLNQVDENGKKHGYWIEYLNYKLRPCKKKKANYFKYRYYYKGMSIARDDYINNITTPKIEINGNQPVKDSIVILDGTYIIRSKSMGYIEWIYNNGYPVTCKIYTSTNYLTEVWDYSKPYKNQLGSVSIIYYGLTSETLGKVIFNGHLRRCYGKWRVWVKNAEALEKERYEQGKFKKWKDNVD